MYLRTRSSNNLGRSRKRTAFVLVVLRVFLAIGPFTTSRGGGSSVQRDA